MTTLSNVPKGITHAMPLRPSISRLSGMINLLRGWYERKMQERALACLSMSELKDIGYPTAGDLRFVSPPT
jgi:hypothetical protein